MPDAKLHAAAALMGQALGGISLVNDELAGDFTIDHEQERVWAEIELPSGDVYELSTKWARDKSP